MTVRSKKVDIARAAESLAADYSARISSGQSVQVAPAEILPQRDTTHIKLLLDSTSTPADRLVTALFVSTNTLFRDGFKKEVWTELKAGMEAKKLPAPIIQHAEAGSNAAVDAALDRQIPQWATDAREGRPLISQEDAQKLATYQAAHPKLNAAAAPDAAGVAKPNDFDKPLDANQVNPQLQSKDPDAMYAGGDAGAAAPVAGGWESNATVPIRA